MKAQKAAKVKLGSVAQSMSVLPEASSGGLNDIPMTGASYSKWDGWAAAFSSCDDLAKLRQDDGNVHRLLSKLDALMNAKEVSSLYWRTVVSPKKIEIDLGLRCWTGCGMP